MVRRILITVLLCAGMAWAQPATRPATPATQPSTQPSSRRMATPAEIFEQMRLRREQEMSKSKVAYIDLSDPITEKPAGFSLLGLADSHTLHNVIRRLHQARDDSTVRAVLITIGAGAEINLAQAQEIRDAIIEFRRAGKKTFVYADSYDTISYTLASGASNICLPQGGEIMIPGVGLQATFYKGIFDKVGVTADYVQIGEYKGAEEPFTRTAPSEELKGEMTKLSEAIYAQIVDGISLNRNLATAEVRRMIDEAMMSASVAKDRGFIDHFVEMDDLRNLLKDEVHNEIDLVAEYGLDEEPELDFSNPLLLLAQLNRRPEESDKPKVALIYVDGVISDGDGSGGLLGEEGVGSDSMRRDLRLAARDPEVKAIVLRIDSPGGSALASEMIWQAIRRISRETHKPVIVSIGSMAASGGYYIASAGDYIFADRCAIVGSIGVVGGKFVLKDLYDKIGVATESFTQGRNADLFSSSQAFSDRQRRMVRTWMQQTYDQFTQRVMSTRKEKIKDIDQVARGRVFLAQQARELGMIDELGGCDDALAHAAGKAGLQPGGYDIRVLPAPRTLAEYLGFGAAQAASPMRPSINISADSILLNVAPELRKLLSQQLQMARLLQQRPVVLMSPFVVTVH